MQPDVKPRAPYQTFKVQERSNEPFRFDQKKRFIAAIAGSIFILLIFIIVAIVALTKSGDAKLIKNILDISVHRWISIHYAEAFNSW